MSMDRLTKNIDQLDARLLHALAASPRAGVLELARQLGVARGTAQARLDGLRQRGVVTGFGPELDLAELGYGVLAFTTLGFLLYDRLVGLRPLFESKLT